MLALLETWVLFEGRPYIRKQVSKVVQKFNIFVKQEVAVLSFVPALNPITELMLMYVHTNLHNKEAIYEFLDAIIFCT